MFTGIVTDLGTVRTIEPAGQGRDLRIVVATAWDTGGIALGASVACNGCCLTVVEKDEGTLAFNASAETLSKTTIGRWRPGTAVNLERSLRLGDELGGHLVQGHIDGVGTVAEAIPEGGSTRVRIRPPPHLMPFIAPKGSVAVDGVSLTVNDVDADAFGVNIIPHTASVTTFGRMKPGDPVNIEVDLVARYLARLLDARS
ncbi:riboflavin synthase [Elioraea tepidiphila]|jgi:riboflavin synthase|uniref:riboflavin synthase n=1 Tax=Elioraea tepidiphila TaxID=457934 RepID=UPI002FD892DE